MNGTFLSKLVAVVAMEPGVPNLNKGDLVGLDVEGELVQLPPESNDTLRALIRITRLQTMLLRERDADAPPDLDEIRSRAATLGQNVCDAAAATLATKEDGARRLQMLESLIVECVRELVPAECEHLGVAYAIRPDRSIVRQPATERRTLD